MQYRYLGNTGLRVSVLSWGNWVNVKNDDNCLNSVKYAFSKGVNFFDTAEIYGYGEAEVSLGEALKALNAPRKDYVVSTKLWKVGNGVNDTFLSRKHVIEGLTNSLKRLQLDYVDIVFCHRFDKTVDLKELCKSMNYLIENGMAFYWGTSEWEACQIVEAINICDNLGLCRPVVEQSQYNFFNREKLEKEYVYLFDKYKLATTTWSPLLSGIITGKYLDSIPEDSRLGKFGDSSAAIITRIYNRNKKIWDPKIKDLLKLAEEMGVSIAQLAVAWIIKNPDTTTCLLGNSKLSQLEDNIGALDVVEKNHPRN